MGITDSKPVQREPCNNTIKLVEKSDILVRMMNRIQSENEIKGLKNQQELIKNLNSKQEYQQQKENRIVTTTNSINSVGNSKSSTQINKLDNGSSTQNSNSNNNSKQSMLKSTFFRSNEGTIVKINCEFSDKLFSLPKNALGIIFKFIMNEIH